MWNFIKILSTLIALSAAFLFIALFFLISKQYSNLHTHFLYSLSLPYQLGEVVAFLGLLVASINKLMNPAEERGHVTRFHLIVIVVFMIMLSIAYTVRTPFPSDALSITNSGYVYLSLYAQLKMTYIIGMLTSLLSVLGIWGIASRFSILLLIVYFMYFCSGIFLFTPEIFDNVQILIPLLVVNSFVVLLGILSLMMIHSKMERFYELFEYYKYLRGELEKYPLFKDSNEIYREVKKEPKKKPDTPTTPTEVAEKNATLPTKENEPHS